MSDLALPPHLRGRLHGDWPWPFKKVSRGWNAVGPRPATDAEDYMAWPPRLVEGKGVARWEREDGSILMIPELVGRVITAKDFYGKEWRCVEMNPSAPDFLNAKVVFFPQWAEAHVYDVPIGDGKFKQTVFPEQYSPSALQKFSESGWMRLSPKYKSTWKVFKKRELPIWPEKGDDIVFFTRAGARPDHVDCYYNTDKLVPIGFIGLKWE